MGHIITASWKDREDQYIQLFHYNIFKYINLFIWVLTLLSTHRMGHIIMASWKDREDQYIQLVKVWYCKLPTNGKQLPALPLEVWPGTEPQSQRWKARVLAPCHRGPIKYIKTSFLK